MEIFPSISRDVQKGIPIFAFDKLDGSNVRAEWTRKNNKFIKFGLKKRLLSKEEPIFGEAIDIMIDKYEKFLSDFFIKERYEKTVSFFEFYGENSFAGNHMDEKHTVILLDIFIFKKGFLHPKDFYESFYRKIDIPKLLYRGNANEQLIKSVNDGELPGMTFEGVVCKGGIDKKRKPILFKIKNKAWIEKLKNHCKGDENLFEQLL